MKRSGINIMSRLISLVRPLTGYMFLAIITGFLGHLSATFITVLGGLAVVQILAPKWSISINTIFITLLILALLRGFLRYAEQSLNHFIAFKLLALIRDKVFGALRRLSPAKLEAKDKGNLISIITSDVELLEVFYAHTVSPIGIAFLFCIVMVFLIGSHHFALGILALIAYLVVGVVIPVVTSKLSGDNSINFRSKSGEMASFVLDSLRGLSEILQYGQGEKRLDQMNKKSDDLSKYEEKIKRTTGRNNAVTNTVILLFDLAMLFLSAYLCDFSGALICTLAMMSSFGPFVALASLGSTLQNTFAAGNRVLDILDEHPVVEDVSGNTNLQFQSAAAENVSFAYDSEIVLNDFSVEIPQNKIIGIVGRSGSGKSTLLKLFMRFWEVRQGAMKISGRNVNEINTRNLRDMESFVTQETHLFHDSIRNNLLIAKLDASDEEIISACKKAAVHDFIMSLPQGYDTPVGELGDTLSSGERQRLSLARAFLHDAPFLLLDEPSSNLDSLNEAVILKSLHEERAGRTVVLVSHRKSTMGIVDKPYSVEHGRMS